MILTLVALLISLGSMQDSTLTAKINKYLSLDSDTLIYIQAYPVFRSLDNGEEWSEEYVPILLACLLAPLDGEYSQNCGGYFYKLLANNEFYQRQIIESISRLSKDEKEKAIFNLSNLLEFEFALDHTPPIVEDFCELFSYLHQEGAIIPSSDDFLNISENSVDTLVLGKDLRIELWFNNSCRYTKTETHADEEYTVEYNVKFPFSSVLIVNRKAYEDFNTDDNKQITTPFADNCNYQEGEIEGKRWFMLTDNDHRLIVRCEQLNPGSYYVSPISYIRIINSEGKEYRIPVKL